VEILRRHRWPLMAGDDRPGFLVARRSLVLRPASSVEGLGRCVEVGRSLSVIFDALHEAGAIELAWLLRARDDAILRPIKVGEDWMAHEIRIEPQNLRAVGVELCNDFCLGAEQAEVVN
jgi:hypothetical protein